MSTLQSQPGDPAIITDPSYVIDHEFPPTNYQPAPQPTRDLESVTCCPAFALHGRDLSEREDRGNVHAYCSVNILHDALFDHKF